MFSKSVCSSSVAFLEHKQEWLTTVLLAVQGDLTCNGVESDVIIKKVKDAINFEKITHGKQKRLNIVQMKQSHLLNHQGSFNRMM